MKLISLVLLTLVSLNVIAQDCKDVNLITQNDSPFKKIPVYDQDGLGACYAFTAAQMMDYYLIKNKKRTTSSASPIWVGVKYAMTMPGQGNITGGSASAAIQAVRKEGLCDAEEANKILDEFAKKGKIRKEELVSILEEYSNLNRNFSSPDEFKPGPLNQKFVKQVRQGKLFDQAIKNHNKKYCPTDPHFEELERLLKGYLDLPVKYILDRLAKVSCPKPQTYVVPAPINHTLKKNEDVEKKIISQLLNNRSPAGISYCAALWKDPDFGGAYLRKQDGTSLRWDGCRNHASIVTGMKPVNNQCHFLVRNTWGSQFSSSTAKWKCLCKNKKTKAYVDDCTNKTHNNGQFTVEACWIPSSILNKNVYGMQTLD